MSPGVSYSRVIPALSHDAIDRDAALLEARA
jgi:hypothetical protein